MKPDRDKILNGWLKYHNTNVEEVNEKLPLEVRQKPDWFGLYPVSQEQYDEWKAWAVEYIAKVTGYSKGFVERKWWSIELDCAPTVNEEKIEK